VCACRATRIPKNNGIFYFLTDHLGSTTVTLDADGVPVGELRYRAASRSAAEGPGLRGDALRQRRTGDGLPVHRAEGVEAGRAVLLLGEMVSRSEAEHPAAPEGGEGATLCWRDSCRRIRSAAGTDMPMSATTPRCSLTQVATGLVRDRWGSGGTLACRCWGMPPPRASIPPDEQASPAQGVFGRNPKLLSTPKGRLPPRSPPQSPQVRPPPPPPQRYSQRGLKGLRP
jgi:hypothetical protein